MAEPALSAKTFDKTWPYFPEILTLDESRWAAARDWLFKRGVIKKQMSLDTLFTNRFVPAPQGDRRVVF